MCIQVRIYSRPEMIDFMALAANVTVMSQQWLETETGIPYLLPKMGLLLYFVSIMHMVLLHLYAGLVWFDSFNFVSAR